MMTPPYPPVQDLGLPLDLVVSAFIVHAGSVLLVDHRLLGCWLPLGGHVEIGETTDDALFREIREESGLELGPKDALQLRPVPLATTFHNRRSLLVPAYVEVHDFHPIPGHRHMAMVYYLHADSDQIRHDDAAHRETRWFTRDELCCNPIPPPIFWYAWDAIRLFDREDLLRAIRP